MTRKYILHIFLQSLLIGRHVSMYVVIKGLCFLNWDQTALLLRGSKNCTKIHATKSLTSLFQIYQNESCQQTVYLEDFFISTVLLINNVECLFEYSSILSMSEQFTVCVFISTKKSYVRIMFDFALIQLAPRIHFYWALYKHN